MAKFINSSGPLHLNIYIEQVSQDIANNSSGVSWKATVDRDGAYRTYTYGNISNLSVWLNGSSVHSSHLDFDTSGQEFTLASGEVSLTTVTELRLLQYGRPLTQIMEYMETLLYQQTIRFQVSPDLVV